jgi:phage terminase small subunit
MHKDDRPRSRTLTPAALVPQHAFPEAPPDDLFYGLTAAEREFVKAYVESADSYQAYVRAGLEHGQRRPKNLAWQYLQKPRVKAAVHKLQTFFMKHMQIHAEHVLGLLFAHATADARQLYVDNGETWELLPMARWPLELRQSVQRVRVVERTSKDGEVRREIDVELVDRQRALALLGKHLRLFERKQELAPFTLVLNTNSEPIGPKQVGQTIEGIGLQIRLPEPEC